MSKTTNSQPLNCFVSSFFVLYNENSHENQNIQPVRRPPVVVQTVLPSAPPLADYDTEAIEEGPMHYPLSGSTTPSASGGGGNKKDGGSSGQCLICMDAPSDGICVPCGHVAGCMSCLTQIKSHASECPICRANIHQVMKVYRV